MGIRFLNELAKDIEKKMNQPKSLKNNYVTGEAYEKWLYEEETEEVIEILIEEIRNGDLVGIIYNHNNGTSKIVGTVFQITEDIIFLGNISESKKIKLTDIVSVKR